MYILNQWKFPNNISIISFFFSITSQASMFSFLHIYLSLAYRLHGSLSSPSYLKPPFNVAVPPELRFVLILSSTCPGPSCSVKRGTSTSAMCTTRPASTCCAKARRSCCCQRERCRRDWPDRRGTSSAEPTPCRYKHVTTRVLNLHAGVTFLSLFFASTWLRRGNNAECFFLWTPSLAAR